MSWNIIPKVSDDIVRWDIPLAEELALHAGRAVNAAMYYEQEHRVSQTFQSAALPNDLPNIDGIKLSVRYEAGRTEALVGGDWYDAFPLPDGRLVLSIGDVAGSGLDAAVTMGTVRQSIRTAALINPNPLAVLDAVDRVVRAACDRFVTAFVAIFDPLFGDLRYACAGHPRPLLRSPNGDITELDGGGLPLGLREDHESRIFLHQTLSPGSSILFYTDGLVEADRDLLTSEAQLIDLLAVSNPMTMTADSLYEGIFRDKIAHDDVALMLFHYEHSPLAATQPKSAYHWHFHSADGISATAARHEFRSVLDQHGLKVNDIQSSEIIFGELIGNGQRYASGDLDVYVDLTTPYPVLHVLDRGPGVDLNPRLPSDPMSERGRGAVHY